MSEPANENRDLPDLRIAMLPGGGFVVSIAGEPFAAYTTAREMCHWLEKHLAPLEPADTAEPLPAMLQAKPEPPKRRGIFNREG